MPAYSVLETGEYTGGIVFAKDTRTASRIGANQWADGEIEYVEVSRRKDLDQYEGKGVPASLLVEEGWRFECHGCGMMINDYGMEDAGLPLSGIVGVEGCAIYCCHQCSREHLSREAAVKAYGSAFQDMLRDMLRARFRNAILVPEDQWKNRVSVPKCCDPLVVCEASIAFSFPGQKIGPATLTYRHEGIHGLNLIGPVRPYFTCCAGDKEAFEAWAALAAMENQP